MKHQRKSLLHQTLKLKFSLFKDKEKVFFHNTICILKKPLQEFLIIYTELASTAQFLLLKDCSKAPP